MLVFCLPPFPNKFATILNEARIDSMEINVLFSAISTPEEVIVESSLRSISSKARIIVLTSKQKRISWENRADKVEITRFSSRKRINRFVKIASNRSSFFRKTLHILLKKLFSKTIH